MGAMLFHQNTGKTGNNTIEMSQVFRNITWFKHFTNLNLFKYVFNVIQDWETNAKYNFFNGAYFLLAVAVEGDKSSWLRMAN